ncbi:MAG TPA: hypothetical protein ENH08_05665, partial [Chromatiales bacterium]|nr:hypothetical protein [Chromatiales bacterium]
MADIGEQIKAAGWRQGCLLRRADLPGLRFDLPADQFAIVVSQSCDLVHHSLDTEPNIEIVTATSIPDCGGQYTHA